MSTKNNNIDFSSEDFSKIREKIESNLNNSIEKMVKTDEEVRNNPPKTFNGLYPNGVSNPNK